MIKFKENYEALNEMRLGGMISTVVIAMAFWDARRTYPEFDRHFIESPILRTIILR